MCNFSAAYQMLYIVCTTWGANKLTICRLISLKLFPNQQSQWNKNVRNYDNGNAFFRKTVNSFWAEDGCALILSNFCQTHFTNSSHHQETTMPGQDNEPIFKQFHTKVPEEQSSMQTQMILTPNQKRLKYQMVGNIDRIISISWSSKATTSLHCFVGPPN